MLFDVLVYFDVFVIFTSVQDRGGSSDQLRQVVAVVCVMRLMLIAIVQMTTLSELIL
jgi:hypothetical protein